MKFLAVLLFFFSANLFAEQIPVKNVSITVNRDSVINSVSDNFFGQNYWMWCDSWSNKIRGTEQQIAKLKIKLLRFGGISVDLEYPDPITNGVLSELCSYCKKIGAEPMLQIPIARYTNSKDKVENAISLIKRFKKIHNLTYVSIGNEPDIYASTLATNSDYKADYLSDYKVDNYCSDFNDVATAIKKNFPELKIIGLELSWNYDVWIPQFVSKCKGNFDILSVHYYPFTPGACRFSKASNQFTELNNFYIRIKNLVNSQDSGTTIPLMIGETNITYDGDPQKSNLDASPGTFAAGLWFADFIGVSSAQKNLFSVMPWSIREDWTLGFLTSHARPVFYSYEMFSNFYKKNCIHIENIDNALRVYGYKDDQNNMSFFTVNWDTTSSYAVNVSFTDTSLSKYTFTVPPYSLSCLELSSDIKKGTLHTYTKRLEFSGPVSDDNKKFKSQFEVKKAGRFKFVPVNK